MRNCPFCGGEPETLEHTPTGGYTIGHAPSCFLYKTHKYLLGDEEIRKWNVREPDWEQRWGELVETTGRRISESIRLDKADGGAK